MSRPKKLESVGKGNRMAMILLHFIRNPKIAFNVKEIIDVLYQQGCHNSLRDAQRDLKNLSEIPNSPIVSFPTANKLAYIFIPEKL